MARFSHLQLVGIAPETSIVTAKRTLTYLDQSTSVPQRKSYENTHGIVVLAGQEMAIDVREEQLPAFQAAHDAGHVLVEGLPAKTVAKKA